VAGGGRNASSEIPAPSPSEVVLSPRTPPPIGCWARPGRCVRSGCAAPGLCVGGGGRLEWKREEKGMHNERALRLVQMLHINTRYEAKPCCA